MATNDGGPAFPSGTVIKGGMSLRDYFAAKAMQAIIGNYRLVTDGKEDGIISGSEPDDSLAVDFCSGNAKAAYIIADAMLSAREAKP